jgi:hypothetical protein
MHSEVGLRRLWLTSGVRRFCMLARITILALLLSGCSSPRNANTSALPSATPNPPSLAAAKFWTPSSFERSSAEGIASSYAFSDLGLSPEHIRKMNTNCIGWHKDGRKELHIQFYDPDVFSPSADGFFEPMYGGFPSYFTVTVDVGKWRVVDHYASRE